MPPKVTVPNDLTNWKNLLIGPNAQYKVTAFGNQWIVNEGNLGERFLYVYANGDVKFFDIDEYVNTVLQEYSGNKTETLRKALYDSKYLSSDEYKSKDAAAFNNAIANAGRKFTVNTVQNFVNNPILANTKPLSIGKWLTSQPGRPSSTDTGTSTTLTSQEQAGQELDEFFFNLLGEGATDAEKEEYFKLLNAAQKKAKITETVDAAGNRVTTGERLDETDLLRIKSTVLKKRVTGTPLDKLAGGNGTIAQGVSELKEYASNYGIRLDTKAALDQIMSGMTPGGTLTTGSLDSQKNAIKSMSKAFYANLSGLIDSGVKPSDIANQFAYYKGQLLETPDNAYNIFDEDIQTAMKNDGKDGVMSINEYQMLLRTNPKTKQAWLKTKAAKEEAAGYAYDILNTFGLMA